MEAAILKIIANVTVLAKEIGQHPKRIIPILGFVLIILVLVGIIAAVMVFGAELRSQATYYETLDKKISLLKSLNELEKDGIKSHPELSKVYEQTIIELSLHQITPFTIPPIRFPDTLMVNEFTFYKALSGAFVGILFFFIALLFVRDGKREVLKGAIIVAVAFGLLGAALPTINPPIVNFIGLPIVEIIALYLYGGWRTPKRPNGQSMDSPVTP